MKNEIERKTTSLILMTIMVAGGLTFAIPSMEPVHAQSTPNLYVSAVSEKFDNTFGGLQVVEVVVSDPQIMDDDDAQPRVTVDGDTLGMNQALDGSWYGYFRAGTDWNSTNTPDDEELLRNVINIRDNDNNAGTLNTHIHPITVEDGDTFDVIYHKGGNPQRATITYDDSTNNGIELDRSSYPTSANVYLTITDHVLNIDPTDNDVWEFTVDGDHRFTYRANGTDIFDGDDGFTATADALGCDDDCLLRMTDNRILDIPNDNVLTFEETEANSGVFELRDNDGDGTIMTNAQAPRATNTEITYDDIDVSVNIRLNTATIDLDIPGGTWNSGEEITLTIVDADQNRDSDSGDDQTINNRDAIIPTLVIGDRDEVFTLADDRNADIEFRLFGNDIDPETFMTGLTWLAMDPLTIDMDTGIGLITINTAQHSNNLEDINDGRTGSMMISAGVVSEYQNAMRLQDFTGVNLLSYDFSSLGASNHWIMIYDDLPSFQTDRFYLALDGDGTGILDLATDLTHFAANNDETHTLQDDDIDDWNVVFVVEFTSEFNVRETYGITADVFSVGQIDDGQADDQRINNQIIRIEVEETGDNTGTFTGTLEYTMVNQLTLANPDLYTNLATTDNKVKFIAFEALTGSDARINYADMDANGQATTVSAQQDITTSTGVVSLNSDRYSVGSNVVVTLEDADLNTDSGSRQTYVVPPLPVPDADQRGDRDRDQVGINVVDDPDDDDDGNLETLLPGQRSLGMLLEVTIGGERWQSGMCDLDNDIDNGLGATGFTLQETGPNTGVFTGSFTIPTRVCNFDDDGGVNRDDPNIPTSGREIAVTYQDFRDADGQIITVGDSASIGASTGSISLDRTVYPVPFGPDGNANNVRSHFELHDTAMDENRDNDPDALPEGIVTAYIRVNDPDFNLSPSGVDEINLQEDRNVDDNGFVTSPPVTVSIVRSGNAVVLGYAGSTPDNDHQGDNDRIFRGDANAAMTSTDNDDIMRFGPLTETSPESGIFEIDIEIEYTDGPLSRNCEDGRNPVNDDDGMNRIVNIVNPNERNGRHHCILQGDILQVEYRDPADASGNERTVTDSATFDLRNGALQTDKSVYVIGSDMIVTLIDPDLDLDSKTRETYNLGLIEWDSDAGTATLDGTGTNAVDPFDPAPGQLQETGPNSGIFQVVATIPDEIDDRLQRGEEIVLEYVDWGPSGADYVGDNDEEIRRTIFTSNFGATIELDQNVYSWTDKVFITITAPDHNFDSNQVETIGDTEELRISTREDTLDEYELAETGTNTGIFTGEVILTGFGHDADGDADTGNNGEDVIGRTCVNACGGPTDGLLRTSDDDGLDVSFEFSEDEFVRKSALIRWNIGEIQWLQASYPATSTGVLRVIDADMNWNPESADNFEVRVWSDNSPSGITLTVTETQPASGIFEGTIFFGHDVGSGGHRLSVNEGDTVTARYDDNTLPNPYSRGDSEFITATTIIGTIVPPLERVDIESLRIADSTGTTLSTVSVDQQVQITADITNTQDKDQPFAYLVQIQDTDGVTVSLSWLDGSLSPNQSLSPSQSWIPTAPGTYTITVFAWESLTTPTALSPQQTTTVTVN